MATSPFPPPMEHFSDHDTGDSAPLCSVSQLEPSLPGRCSCPGLCLTIGVLGSDAGFLCRHIPRIAYTHSSFS